jgi:primosomal replication protein N''
LGLISLIKFGTKKPGRSLADLEKCKKLVSLTQMELSIRPHRLKYLDIFNNVYESTVVHSVLDINSFRESLGYTLDDLNKLAKLEKYVTDMELEPSQQITTNILKAAKLELLINPIRKEVLGITKNIYSESELYAPKFLNDLLFTVNRSLSELRSIKDGVDALYKCPRQDVKIETRIKSGFEGLKNLLSAYEISFARFEVRNECLGSLKRLAPFLGDEFNTDIQYKINNNQSNLNILKLIEDSLFSLSAFQKFRKIAIDLSPEILSILSVLRMNEDGLKNYTADEFDNVIRRIIAREGLLSCKDNLELNNSILKISKNQLSRKVDQLVDYDSKMRNLNKKYLSEFRQPNMVLESEDEWEDLTRLRGPRSRRLREIIENGWYKGLAQLRPIWLMSPDVASQLLPLIPGMFDLVIFDEASQIPVENSFPTLYRGKRVVISGDEKQMPPTRVFTKNFGDDGDDGVDDNDYEELNDDVAHKDSLNRKEIKDCSDLLVLGKSVLPKSMLKIHYRSKYRELISFSNSAFYENLLSIPVMHPENVIRNIRPIEVIRVDGLYTDQTNKEEAIRVVELLAETWKRPKRPSIGVVTFNTKQAQLIRDLLVEKSENDHLFGQIYSIEKERVQDGEDMGFFVKNVESAQGDERDMIIFSSTFGRDSKGTFKRQFGPLSQIGGERRLNVAITRAREKITIVTSMPINEISSALPNNKKPKTPRDYLQAYFDYAIKISSGSLTEAVESLNRINSKNLSNDAYKYENEDGFLNSVSSVLKNLSLKFISNTTKDVFELDFIIEDAVTGRFGLGIECDAHRHPLLEKARAREIWRLKTLRLGIPNIYRISHYEWYHNRDREINSLRKAIEDALDISFSKNAFSLEGA